MKNHNWTIFLFPLLYVTADFVTILKQNIGYNTAGKQPEVTDYSLALNFTQYKSNNLNRSSYSYKYSVIRHAASIRLH